MFELPKKHLLCKGWEFERVYKQGRRVRGKGFSLIVYPNDLDCNRIGISIHRQIRGAVKRNRIKRIIRESFRLHRELYPQGADIVFAIRPDADLDSPSTIIQAITSCCPAKRNHPVMLS